MGKIYYFLVSDDPGLTRLRKAISTTLSTAVSSLILFQLSQFIHQPRTFIFLGISVALYGSLMINDPSLKQRKITTLLLPFPASASLIAGTFASNSYYLSMGIFIFLTYISVSGRRYGPRFVTLGFVGIMSFFGAIYFQAKSQNIHWNILAIFIGTIISYIFQFWISLSRPNWIYKWYLDAFDARIFYTLKFLCKSFASPENLTHINKNLYKITESALMLEGFLKIRNNPSLETQIFETEFGLNRLVESIRSHYSSLDTSSKSQLSEILLCLGKNDPTTSLKIEKFETHEDLKESLLDLTQKKIGLFLNIPPMEPSQKQISTPPFPTPSNELHIYTKHAIQAALAVAAASVVGGMLSTSRWVWAAMTAFVVFSGTTRGDTFTKSAFRIIGTSLGLFFGMIIIQFNWDKNFNILLIFVAIFFGSYFIRIAYSITTFWFTLLLFGLYKYMGILNTEIIILRLEETFLGVFFAILAAIFILPTYTQRGIGLAVSKLLEDLANLLDVASNLDEQKKIERIARNIDRDLQNLNLQAQPFLSGFPGPYTEQIKGLLHDVFALTLYTRSFTGFLVRHLEDEGLRLSLHHRTKELSLKANKAYHQLKDHLLKNKTVDILKKEIIEHHPESSGDHYSRTHLLLNRMELLIETILGRFKTTQWDQ